MKILMVNKFFYIKGGSETYYFALKNLLKKNGHTVIDFSMLDKKNFASDYTRYFIKNVEYNSKQSVFNKFKCAKNIIYSFEAKRNFEKLILDTKPDIIHLHIFQHQISPSILDVIKKYKIPTVYTAHDLKMLCLNYKMLNRKGICTDCKNGHYFHCLQHKCVKDSFLKSGVNVIEGYFHKLRKSYDAIDYVITPSEFYKNKFIQFGYEKNRIIHIPNFLCDREDLKPKIEGCWNSYYLYLGRLSEEKGILTLVKAFLNFPGTLKIAGSGPQYNLLKSFIEENRMDNVILLGFQSGEVLNKTISDAKAIILPSEWFENGPYSAIEALRLAKPIIGANIGGIPELVNNNGFLFESKNVDSLKNTLYNFEKLTKEEIEYMQYSSLNLYKKYYSEEYHYNQLMDVYKKALKRCNIK